jgi:hypothetical protein
MPWRCFRDRLYGTTFKVPLVPVLSPQEIEEFWAFGQFQKTFQTFFGFFAFGTWYYRQKKFYLKTKVVPDAKHGVFRYFQYFKTIKELYHSMLIDPKSTFKKKNALKF